MQNQEALLGLELHQAQLQTFADAAAIRPKGTVKSYDPKALEFTRWCEQKGFLDGGTVSAAKLHLFFKTCVVGRPSRKKRKKDDGSSVHCTVGAAVIKSYTASIVDLWSQQVMLRTNSNPHPRDNSVKSLIRTLDVQNSQHKRQNYQDRGVGSMIDGYTTTKQLSMISNYFLCRDSFEGNRDKAAFF
jgi:hypothetical protein